MADDPVDVASVESGENATLLPTLQMDASEPADLPSPMKQEATPTTNGPDTDMIEAAVSYKLWSIILHSILNAYI